MCVSSHFVDLLLLTWLLASSWEYSFFAPHSMSSLVSLMGGNEMFVNRTEHYFDKGYYLAGNEPSFAMPFAYNYAGRPDLTAKRVRDVVFGNFGTGIGGVCFSSDLYLKKR